MTINATLKEAMASQETGEVLVVLLTINHPNLTQPIRVCSDSVETLSQSRTFIPYPFTFKAPDEAENGPTPARLIIDNVGEIIAESIQLLDSPASVDVEFVLASSPNHIQIAWPTFELTNVEGDELTISGDLTIPGLMTEPVGGTIDPAGYPALF